MKACSIGKVARHLGISVETLRYYEAIKLIPKVARTSSGYRAYSNEDISRLEFIMRAEAMHFSLADIRKLVRVRDNPISIAPEIREYAAEKLGEVKKQLDLLKQFRDELQILIELAQVNAVPNHQTGSRNKPRN